MPKLFLVPLVIVLVFTSCGQNSNKTEAGQAVFFFNSVNNDLHPASETQQRLIDTATQMLLTLKKDSLALIDITSFRTLLDSAKGENQRAERKIEKKAEVDLEINYKQKVIDYLILFDSLDDKFEKSLNIFEQNEGNRFEEVEALIMPTLKIIKEKELIFKDAKQEFKNKYPTDEYGNVRSKPDYKYVKLSDFHYEPANINEGEEIILLSFSGLGKVCTDKTLYFRQFIGIQKSTGDTVRIISPCQDYEVDKEKKIGYFEPGKGLWEDDFNHISSDNSFIVFNEHQTSLETRNYKTAIGRLDLK